MKYSLTYATCHLLKIRLFRKINYFPPISYFFTIFVVLQEQIRFNPCLYERSELYEENPLNPYPYPTRIATQKDKSHDS